MKKDTYIEDQILNYISGEMDDKERIVFENLLNEDKALRARVDNELLLKENIRKYHLQKVKKQLQTIHKKNVKRKTRFKYVGIAAVWFLILFSGIIYFTKEEKVNNQMIYAQYYEKYELESGTRAGREDSLDDVFAKYQNDSFNLVIENIDAFILKHIPASKKLVIGISYLELNELDKAKNIFQSIIDEQDIMFIDQALWYKALAEIKSDNITSAKILLTELLKDNSSDHYDSATELIKSLRNLK